MKKLMTMLAAVATAFGLYAADPVSYGTSFETPVTVGSLFGQDEGTNWVATAETNADTAVVKAYGDTITPIQGKARPDQFQGAPLANYLDVKTTLTKPLLRALDTAWDLADGNFYVDTLVRFTNFDEAPTSIDGKIAVWVQEIDNGDNTITTNLMVTAGSDATGTRKDYLIQSGFVPTLDSGWTRVTIKAIPEINSDAIKYVGFVVYINGVQVGCKESDSKADIDLLGLTLTPIAKVYNDTSSLFLSTVQTGKDKNVLSAVAFDGQGQIDDVSLTSVAPSCAADPQFFTIDADEHVVEIDFGGVKYAKAKLPVALPWEDESDEYTFTATYDGGYTDGAWQMIIGNVTNTISGKTFKPGVGGASGKVVSQAALVKIGDKSYATLEDALKDTAALSAAGGKVDIAAPLTLTSALTVNVKGSDEAAIPVVLDLAGNTITYADTETFAITAATPLTITDSSKDQTGKIAATKAVYMQAAGSAINAGNITGEVGAEEAVGKFISGGAFALSLNPAYIVDGYDLDEEPLESGLYPIVPATYGIYYYDADKVTLLVLSPDEYVFGDDVKLPTPEMTGYTFVQWNGFDAEEFVYEKGVTTGDIEIYAVWQSDSYTIRFISGEGELTTNNYTKAYGETIEAPTPATVTGKSFKGWDSEVVSPVVGDAEYTAIYTNNIYAIEYTYVDDKGDEVTGVVNGNPTSFEFGTGVASFDETLLTGYDTATYTFKEFTPASIAADATAPATITVTFTKKSGDWPTPDPAKPEAEAVAEAMTEAGFSSAAAAAIGTRAEYTAFQGYCDEQSIIPSEVGAAKDNAILTYALGADACNEEITSEDITITAYDQATGKLTVEIEGVTAGETINSTVLAKVLTAKGGAELKALSTDNVNVTGYAPAAGEVEVTVTPKAENPAAFFYQIELVK